MKVVNLTGFTVYGEGKNIDILDIPSILEINC